MQEYRTGILYTKDQNEANDICYIIRPFQVDSLLPVSLASKKHDGARGRFIIHNPETALTSMF